MYPCSLIENGTSILSFTTPPKKIIIFEILYWVIDLLNLPLASNFTLTRIILPTTPTGKAWKAFQEFSHHIDLNMNCHLTFIRHFITAPASKRWCHLAWTCPPRWASVPGGTTATTYLSSTWLCPSSALSFQHVVEHLDTLCCSGWWQLSNRSKITFLATPWQPFFLLLSQVNTAGSESLCFGYANADSENLG